MIEIIKSETLTHLSPHVFHDIIDNSAVPAPNTSVATGTLFTPVYTDKGPTGVVKYFTGNTALKDMLDTFGQPNVRKLGLPYTAAYEHAVNGGDVVLISVKHESATMAGFQVNLDVETKDSEGQRIEKVLGWILPDGTGFVADPNASEKDRTNAPSANHTVHKVSTIKVSFSTKDVESVNTSDEMELNIKTEFDSTAEAGAANKKSYPFIWGLYKGKGQYGNNFQVHFADSPATIKGRPNFIMNIYDKREASFVSNTQQAVSLSADRQDGIPLFIQRRYQYPYSSGDFFITTLDNMDMNKIGKYIQDELKKIVLFPNGAKNAGVEAEAMEERLKDFIALFDLPEDEDYHRMSYFDPCDFSTYREFIAGSKLSRADFNGGSEGVLADMPRKGFSWDLEVNVADSRATPKMEKVLQTMFVNAFIGKYSSDVFNLLTNPCDYVIDWGYPTEVKKAMVSFSTNRDDVQILFNAPLSTKTVAEAIAWKQGFNTEGRNIFYYPGSFNFVDSKTDKTVKVPQTFAMMYNILDHYQSRRYMMPIAGLDTGVIMNVEPGSAQGVGDLSLAQNDKLLKAGFNIMSAHQDGVLYMDSQKANYLLNEVSDLQEFHNNSITNRILKALYIALQYYKHKLNTANQVARMNSDIGYELNTTFASKVNSIAYNCGFASTYNESIGLIDHNIDIQFNNSIKYHKINLTALGRG